MPLVLNSPKTITITDSSGTVLETSEINAIKIVATPNDNDLNITTAFIEEGFYDATAKTFTPYRRLPELVLDATQYAQIMVDAKALYDNDSAIGGDTMGVYIAQKLASYAFLAGQLGLATADYTII